MNKTVIITSATILSIAAGCIPYLWGDDSFFGGWSLFLGTVGGFVGIWVGVVISKRFF
jgi:hypothetical protein